MSIVEIIEVGMRDGLQREAKFIPTEEKLSMIQALIAAGIKSLQVTSFVNPKLVPQMADAEALCAALEKREGIVYSGLVLNPKGLERAAKAGLTYVDVSLSASDSHSRKNANRGLKEALTDFAEMMQVAQSLNMKVRGGIQCAFGYFEPDVSQELVIEIAKRQIACGIESLSLADSTGMAHPLQIKTMLEAMKPILGEIPVILHLHDTRGMGLANVVAGLEAGCRRFDTAFGGLGGCNFIPEALGNIPTEDTVNMLHSMGYETGVDISKVAQVSRRLQDILGQKLPSKMMNLV